MDEETAYAALCSKSHALTKLVELFVGIDSFEQQCVILKGLLQSDLLKQHMVTIEIDPSLIYSAIYEHKCLEISINCTHLLANAMINRNRNLFL